MEPQNKNLYNLHQGLYMPQEETLDIKRNRKEIVIGILKETNKSERRIPLVPEAVNLLVKNGYKVLVETDAGNSAYFSDNEYSEAGAEIHKSSNFIFQNCNIILKISPLTDNEIANLKAGQTVITSMQLSSQKSEYFKTLSEKKVIAIAFELIQDNSGALPLVRAVSEIAGNTSILIASQYLADAKYGKGNMLGGFSGITPTEIVIIGAGTVAEYACRAALGLGACIKVFDNNIYKLRKLQNSLNARIFSSIIQPKILLKSIRTARVVICALHSKNGRTPIIITEDMVKQMKEGSIIIDVSIDQGGCCETSKPTTHNSPVFNSYGITHYCVPNIASRVPHTASYALSNYMGNIILDICENQGTENFIKNDLNFRKGVYIYKGAITNKAVSEIFKLPYQDIDIYTYNW